VPAIILFKTHMGINMHMTLLAIFLKWVEETFTPNYRKEIDAYLGEATDNYDLERRMVVLMKRGMI
jgi:hypothetical protein